MTSVVLQYVGDEGLSNLLTVMANAVSLVVKFLRRMISSSYRVHVTTTLFKVQTC